MQKICRGTRAVGSFPDGYSVMMLGGARLRHISTTKWGTGQYLNTCKHYGEDVKKKKESWTSQPDLLLPPPSRLRRNKPELYGRSGCSAPPKHTRNSDQSESNVRKISDTTIRSETALNFPEILSRYRKNTNHININISYCTKSKSYFRSTMPHYKLRFISTHEANFFFLHGGVIRWYATAHDDITFLKK